MTFFCEVESNVYVLFRWNSGFKGLKPEESSLLLAVLIWKLSLLSFFNQLYINCGSEMGTVKDLKATSDI
jgi:uncharacterized protein (DUF486 family)